MNKLNVSIQKLTSNNAYMGRLKQVLLLVTMSVLMTSNAYAGTDDTFGTWVQNMTDWLEGSLGLGVSLSFVVVGIIGGVVRQSLMPLAVGVGAALGLNIIPGILTDMFSAVII